MKKIISLVIIAALMGLTRYESNCQTKRSKTYQKVTPKMQKTKDVKNQKTTDIDTLKMKNDSTDEENDHTVRFVTSGGLEVSMTGVISHTDYDPTQTGTVTFSRFPATVKEFKEVRKQIGGEPQGAVALQLMAYEMYRHNKKAGEECIRLNTTTSNVSMALSRFNELFGKDRNYQRPYQIAAFLKGATPENGYSPTKPYTVEVRVAQFATHQYSSIFQTTVLYLEVLTQGKDRGAEPISVLKTLKPEEPSEGEYFIVFACSGIYSQVQAIPFAKKFKGLE